MNNEYTQVVLTYNVGGTHLVSPGRYSTAKISRTKKKVQYDCGIKDFETIIDTPSRTLETPKYAKSEAAITLGEKFLEGCLERPRGPKHGFQRWLRSPMGKLYQNWNKLTPERRIEESIAIYVSDITGSTETKFSYELI